MKIHYFTIHAAWVLCVASVLSSHAQGRYPLNRAYMQSDLNAGGYDLTNVHGLKGPFAIAQTNVASLVSDLAAKASVSYVDAKTWPESSIVNLVADLATLTTGLTTKLSLSGGTMTGNILGGGTADLGSAGSRMHDLWLGHNADILGTLFVAGEVTLSNPGNSKPIRTDSSGHLKEMLIGTGLAFNGTTLSASLSSSDIPNLDASKITSGTLDAARLPAFSGGDVTSSAGSAVLTIASAAVTYAKMQNVSATQRLLGRNTAGAGSAEEVTTSQALDWLGTTRGSVPYRGASAWTLLSAATAGYVLTSNGTGADPSYQVAVSVNGTNVPGPVNLTNSATVTFSISGSNVTATATGGGGGGSGTNFDSVTVTNFVRKPIVTLGLSGTNVTGLDWNLGTSFKLILTTNAWFGIPSNVPGTNIDQEISIEVIENGSGGWIVGWTNAAFCPPNGVMPTNTTAANAYDVFTLKNHKTTNGLAVIVPAFNLHL